MGTPPPEDTPFPAGKGQGSRSPAVCIDCPIPSLYTGFLNPSGLVFGGGRARALHCRCCCCIRRGIFNRDQSDPELRPVRDFMACPKLLLLWKRAGEKGRPRAGLPAAAKGVLGDQEAMASTALQLLGLTAPHFHSADTSSPAPPTSVLWPPRAHSKGLSLTHTTVSIKDHPVGREVSSAPVILSSGGKRAQVRKETLEFRPGPASL